ncbi:cobalamin biosynthesis protein CbiX [Rhodococcus sp. D2-41]|uniref:Cobalamin biosynthesis protein CbiX n=1 Tax=Speluncibacter jeojiensis TaxID=2710754 RepID=A0A9X4RIM0_9ACTN|nr:hypothetical protein [Rhodococcus sp. D2-41]MDG3010045.1 cobalamin biosynthesis protein CbiX [Rhodococcus sp. D2-41]MDG3016251.1 hypothetical protein [Corynebacteriales bacterium D3-21]
MTGPADVTVLLSCGHERGELAPGAGPCVPAGRRLAGAVEEALHRGNGPVCVVPMTLGRDPRLIAESARTLRWATGRWPGRVTLAESFGSTGHLIGWLRTAALRVWSGVPDGGEPQPRALLITAPAADPFDDAELFRIARLVRQFGRHRWVEVAFTGGDPDIAEGVDRCLRLGAEWVSAVSAAFGPALTGDLAARPDVDDGGALLTEPAVRRVIDARVAVALDRLDHGDNGIGAGLDAEHGHGYAHSHGPGEHEQDVPGPDVPGPDVHGHNGHHHHHHTHAHHH